MNELTVHQLDVLRNIHERGLVVLWSYRNPTPRYGHDYDDGEDMPRDEWREVLAMEDLVDYPVEMPGGQTMTMRGRVSDWLDVERVGMDSWFENSIGLIDRYVLTDKARQAIGAPDRAESDVK